MLELSDKNIISMNLTLSNRKNWNIIGLASCKEWISNFFNIIKPESFSSSKATNLVYIRAKEKNAEDILKNVDILPELPLEGWNISRLAYLRFLYHPEINYIICDIGKIQEEIEFTKMQLALFPLYREIINEGGLLVHSALLEYKRDGIIIGGPGGNGKSSCCMRIVSPWVPLCDDLTLIVKNKNYYGHPLPTWSNYILKKNEPLFNTSIEYFIPIKAIFFLEKSNEDKIIPIRQREAAFKLTQLSLQVTTLFLSNIKKEEAIEIKAKLFENSYELASKIPCYILRHSLHGEFWKEIEKVL